MVVCDEKVSPLLKSVAFFALKLFVGYGKNKELSGKV